MLRLNIFTLKKLTSFFLQYNGKKDTLTLDILNGLMLLFFYTRRILKTQPPIPQYLSTDVADFISKLLVKDPRQRLGGGEDDAEELKRHAFFKV